MPLHPQARAVLDALASGDLPDLSIVEPRVVRALTAASVAAGAVGEPVARVEDRRLPGPDGEIPVRIYAARDDGPAAPGIVYFHGGGFVYCDLDTHDGVCRSLANAVDGTVVSVDYRLAPEHPFPAAPEDVWAATCWVAEHAREIGVDAGRLAVAGDSAGGNLASVVALMARDRGGPLLRHQLIVYPMCDSRCEHASQREFAEGLLLTERMVRAYWDHYLRRPEDGDHPYASPLRAPDLTGLPPATVITAEYDPLRDEGEAYAARLREAGVDVVLSRYDGMIHGFFSMADSIDAARAAIEEAAVALRRDLAAASA